MVTVFLPTVWGLALLLLLLLLLLMPLTLVVGLTGELALRGVTFFAGGLTDVTFFAGGLTWPNKDNEINND